MRTMKETKSTMKKYTMRMFIFVKVENVFLAEIKNETVAKFVKHCQPKINKLNVVVNFVVCS